MIQEITMRYNQMKAALETLSAYLYAHPELGNQEFESAKRHTDFLEAHNFLVEKAFLDIPTAFKATYDSGLPGPTIAFLSEYDALPQIGHGCGHNMIGTISSGAAIIASEMMGHLGGKIIVFGTPAEENDGAKVDMVDRGVFETVDIALMAHPSNETAVAVECLAMEALQFEYIGRAAHAASCPEKGINALDGVIGLFNHVNALREHMVDSARVHGIISEGGVAANIVPERAVAQFYVRAKTKTYLQELIGKVKNCAQASALATGTQLTISNYEKSYDNMVPSPLLNQVITEHFKSVGIEDIKGARASMGSADAGNVSHVCPTAHAMFAIGDETLAGHTMAFAEATQTPRALEMMEKVTVAYALTALNLLKDKSLVESIKAEHAANLTQA
ncbi:MAG: M20 family metallopeptidase [Clostridia bacterium]|nr:M20 family metallopeptidase [Clostridia bacterium]